MLHKFEFESESGRKGVFYSNWIVTPEFAEAFDKALKADIERLGLVIKEKEKGIVAYWQRFFIINR